MNNEEEIEKALALCTNERGEFRERPCELCPYEKYIKNQQCGRRLKMDALDYIDRLKEQIHKIRQENIRDRKRVRKETAGKLLDKIWYALNNGVLFSVLCDLEKEYGVEVDKNENL